MSNHQYCCQNTAQNYLSHIIPVPDKFNVNPVCLSGMTPKEFIAGLKALTEIIKNIYADIIQNPSEYGFPLVDDIIYNPFNPKAAESRDAPNKLITSLYIAVYSGTLTDDGIAIDKRAFANLCKAKRPTCFKISASNCKTIFRKLSDFGFMFDNDVLSYPDDNIVIRVLYGYMRNVDLNRSTVMALNYYLVSSPADRPAQQIIFAEYLSGLEKDFYIWLNDLYVKSGFYCVGFDLDFNVIYHLNVKEKKRALRCFSQNGNLTIECKLYHIGDYAEVIEKMPERYKQIFRDVKNCSIENCLYKRESCICRVDYIIDGQFYKACTFERFFRFSGFELEDIEVFKHIFSHEANKQQQIKK